MAQVIKTTFKFRRNLASYWAEKNPVLAEGEPCFELDTGKLKIGNGTTAYNDLPYINSTTTVINGDDISIVVNNNVITLKGFDEATAKSVPRKNNGALEWVEMLTKGEIEDMLAYKQDALTPGVNVEFTDDDIIKVLPVAMSDSVSETALAGAKDVWEKMPKPVAKTDVMNQEVGMSPDGKLYTARSEVKTSTSDNGVTINEDGTMEINSVDVNKLSQSPDEELVMNGGTI